MSSFTHTLPVTILRTTCRACMFRFVSFVFNSQPHSAAQCFQSDATHGDPCQRRRPRPRDSSTPRGFTTTPQRQEGQQLPLGTICHGDVTPWPFQLEILECYVAPPCFRSGRWNARAKGEARTTLQTHCQEHYQGVSQSAQRSALARRKHPNVEQSREPPDIFGRFLFVAPRNAAI